MYSLASDGINLYVGGDFFSIDGIQVSNIAMWNGSKWAGLGDGFNKAVFSVSIRNNALHAGGLFTKQAAIIYSILVYGQALHGRVLLSGQMGAYIRL